MGKRPLENSVETHLVNLVEKQIGGMALKGAVPGRRFLDRILVFPGGVTVYCECKRPQGGRYSRHQLETVERLARLGHWVLLINTVNGVNVFAERANWEGDDLLLWFKTLSWHLSQYPSTELYLIGPDQRLAIWEVLPHE